MTPSQKLIYSILEKEGHMAHKEVMRAAGLSKGRASWILLGLYERGHVSQEEIDGTRYHRAIPLYSGLPDIPRCTPRRPGHQVGPGSAFCLELKGTHAQRRNPHSRRVLHQRHRQ